MAKRAPDWTDEWVEQVEAEEHDKGEVICGARTRAGSPCRTPPLRGRARCRMHGGKAPRGVASPHFVHGQRSRTMPARLRDRYEEALADPELLAMSRQIALSDAFEEELLQQLDQQTGSALWSDAVEAFQVVRNATDDAQREAGLAQLGNVLERGRNDEKVRKELRENSEHRRRLADTERRRRSDLQQNLTLEQGMALMTAMVQIIATEVTDRKLLSRLADKLDRLSRHELGDGLGQEVGAL